MHNVDGWGGIGYHDLPAMLSTLYDKVLPNKKGPSLAKIQAQVRAYAPQSDLTLLERAYAFSARAHEGQWRKTGEPYLLHPLEVASVLTQLRMDVASVSAGLLHDVLEDTPHTRADIEAAFGDEVATLVDGVTKIGKIAFRSDQEKQAENFRKMIVCMAEDMRVLLIKLGDRLHNMRTLFALSEAQQRQIAQETLDIYAPLANRLGIGWIKTEMEDLCLRYLEPETYSDLERKVADGQSRREQYIQAVIATVQRTMAAHSIAGNVTGRPKHLFGVCQKMRRRGIPFEEVYDLMGVRMITTSKMDCYALLGLVHALWMPVPGRFKDYIAIAKSNMYQSLHTTVIGPHGRSVEFQIRTDEMHRLAEEGIAAHWVYKEAGRIDPKSEAVFGWLRQFVEWQKEITDTHQFMDSVKGDLFTSTIFVFTPKGDLKELAKGATPIDFAYAIHSEVGHHCVGAKVNGQIVPLGASLKSGDRVTILTSATHHPSRDWLKIVKTSRAKTKVRHFIREQERGRGREIGKNLIEQALRRARLSPPSALKSPLLLAGVKEMGIRTLDDLFVAVGYGKIAAHQAIRPLLSESALKEGMKDRLIKTVGLGISHVRVSGLSDVLVRLSKCCSPVPGDPIIGFITRGRGLAIHAMACRNIDTLAHDRERIIDVTWDNAEATTHCVEICVQAPDRPGMLASVSASIAATGANIKKVDVDAPAGQSATLSFQIEVTDTKHLARALKNITRIPGVLQAKRVK